VTVPLRIANCSGFYGDRQSAAYEMVNDGPIDFLTGDWLAELTMLILARSAAKRPGGGYAHSFVRQMEQVMGTCLDRGIKVVANAGGLDPAGCAEAVSSIAQKLGLAPTIAFIEGDNLMTRLSELEAAGEGLRDFETGELFDRSSELITANAYLGCFGIVDALSSGADIVITGRVTDAAVVCGPAAWHHGWKRDSFDELAGAVVAGHLIECGAQVTGGNYSFFTEVPGMQKVGFPYAEISADGTCVISKHDGTGGEVSIGTVTSQLLYEISGPRYYGPDVTARFDTIQLEQLAPNRVRVFGTRGEAPPLTLKVATNHVGGYRKDLAVALVGLDIEAKAQLVDDAFWLACPYRRDEFASVTTRIVRTDKIDPASNEEAQAQWRITLKDHDENKVGRAVANAVTEIALSTIPGFYGVSGSPTSGGAYGVYQAAKVSASVVPQYVSILGGSRTVVDSSAPTEGPQIDLAQGTNSTPVLGATASVPLGRIVGTRSGDKGGHANLGVFARNDAAWNWLDGFLTTQLLRELLPETATLRIDRFRFPAIRSLNFMIYNLLEEGVAASSRQDGQAKSLGEWLRSRIVDVPTALLDQ
jgi:hypothetical protein